MRSWRSAFASMALATLTIALGACQNSSIHDLARFGHAAEVKALLDANPELLGVRGNLGKTPLHEAAAAPTDEVVKLLLDRGADPSAKDVSGLTPLHSAAILESKAAALELLRRGADIEARDDFGDTPLHLAAIFDKREMIALLVEHGAKVDALNKKGQTPLQVARSVRREEAVRSLKALGAADTP